MVVYCDRCNNGFEEVFEDAPNQGVDCASHYHENYKKISCHYGSKFDTNIYKCNVELSEGNICDTCIEELLELKEIEFFKTYTPLGDDFLEILGE